MSSPAEFEADDTLAVVSGALIASLTTALVEKVPISENMYFWELMGLTNELGTEIAALLYGNLVGCLLSLADASGDSIQEILQGMGETGALLSAGINPDPEHVVQDEDGRIRIEYGEDEELK